MCDTSSWLFTGNFLCLTLFSPPAFPAFLAPKPPFSVPFQPLAQALWACVLVVILAVTWPQGPLDWLNCYLSWKGDRLPCATQCPCTVSPQTHHGKSRSSTFHISSFTRRIDMDICSNYPTFLHPPQEKNDSTHLFTKVLTDDSIQHSFITDNMNHAEAILNRLI